MVEPNTVKKQAFHARKMTMPQHKGTKTSVKKNQRIANDWQVPTPLNFDRPNFEQIMLKNDQTVNDNDLSQIHTLPLNNQSHMMDSFTNKVITPRNH